MRNFTLILIGLFLLGSVLTAEETSPIWEKELIGSLNFNQSSFDNWSEGGEDNLAWQFDLNGKIVKNTEKINWSNSGKFSFGQVQIGDLDARKSSDEISLETVLTYKIGFVLNPYAAATARTQLFKGYVYDDTSKTQISAFLDPGYFTQSVGMGYSLKEILKARLGAYIKETITSDYNSFADDPDTEEIEKTKTEFGAEFILEYSAKLNKIIVFKSKLECYSNLEAFDEIDVIFDNIFTANIAKYLNVNLNIKVVYDKDVSLKRQMKQVLSLGLTYSFI